MKRILFLLFLLPMSLFAQSKSTRTEAEAQALVNQLYERLIQGESFASLASAYSEDLGSAQSGGEIGYLKPKELINDYARVMTKTPVGQIAKPFKTQFGYHIVQVIDKRGKEYNTRQILIKYN